MPAKVSPGPGGSTQPATASSRRARALLSPRNVRSSVTPEPAEPEPGFCAAEPACWPARLRNQLWVADESRGLQIWLPHDDRNVNGDGCAMKTRTKRTRQEALLEAARLYWRLRVLGALIVAFGVLCSTYLLLSGDVARGATYAVLTVVIFICLLHGRKYGRSATVGDPSGPSSAEPVPTPEI